MKKRHLVEKVYKITLNDILCDQSALVTNALNTKFYKFEDLHNYGRKLRNSADMFLLVKPELAKKLIHLREMVLTNDDGNWWFTSLKKDQPLWDHDTLYKIAASNS